MPGFQLEYKGILERDVKFFDRGVIGLAGGVRYRMGLEVDSRSGLKGHGSGSQIKFEPLPICSVLLLAVSAAARSYEQHRDSRDRPAAPKGRTRLLAFPL